MIKEELRSTLKKERAQVRIEQRRPWQQQIYKLFWNLPQYQSAKKVMCYLSFGTEINTWPLVEEMLQGGKSLYVPKIQGKELAVVPLHSKEQLVPGVWGIKEPKQSQGIDPACLDLLVVPGLAFDMNGYRLGYGGGFYDRLLTSTSATTVGLVFSSFVRDVPIEAWDKPVNIVVTEEGVTQITRE